MNWLIYISKFPIIRNVINHWIDDLTIAYLSDKHLSLTNRIKRTLVALATRQSREELELRIKYRIATVSERVGPLGLSEAIRFIMPGAQIDCRYPNSPNQGDVAAINLYNVWRKYGDRYPSYSSMMRTLKIMYPFSSYSEDGIYTNFKYQRWVRPAIIRHTLSCKPIV